MNYINQKESWDEICRKSNNNLLKAVLGNSETSDVTNPYIDKASKRAIYDTIEIDASSRVLDIACGAGRLSLWLAPRIKKMVGIDISGNMIDFARENAAKDGIENAEFYVMDKAALLDRFGDDSFDLALGIWLLKYIMDEAELRDMVKQIMRVTRPGGKVLILDQVNSRTKITNPAEDLSGQTMLRPASFYIALFKEYGMELDDHFMAFNTRIFYPYVAYVRPKLKVSRLKILDRALASALIEINCFYNKLTRHDVKDNGHHVLYFTVRKGPLPSRLQRSDST